MFVKYRQFFTYDLYAVRKVDSFIVKVCDQTHTGWCIKPLDEPRPLAWFTTYDEAINALNSLCAALAEGKNFFDLSACETELEPDVG